MKMRPEVKRYHSPDIFDLEGHVPEDPSNFAFLLQILVGKAGGEGEESFDVEVCTPDWIKSSYKEEGIVWGRHKLIVLEYDYRRIASWIENYVSKCTGETWDEIAEKIGRLGRWEFEDYQEKSK